MNSKERNAVERLEALLAQGMSMDAALWEASGQGMNWDMAHLQGLWAEHLAGAAAKPEAVDVIDMTPTWAELLPLLVHVANRGDTAKARQDALAELMRLAQAVDKLNAKDKQSGLVYHTVQSTDELNEKLAHLVALSCWFEVTPECDDRYTLAVKKDVARLAFPKPLNA